MKPGAKMFLSCPNTPGNGYNTQYRAHVYEWGYDELKTALHEMGFKITQEVGLVMGAREMDAFYESQPAEIKRFYNIMRNYIPTTWLTAIMSIPFALQRCVQDFAVFTVLMNQKVILLALHMICVKIFQKKRKVPV